MALSTHTDEEMTWLFLKDAYRKCDFCGASHRCQEIQQFNPIMMDGFIFCTHCDAYLGTWDAKEGQISRKKDMLLLR